MRNIALYSVFVIRELSYRVFSKKDKLDVTYSSFISFVSGVIGTLSLAWSETSAWPSPDDRDAFPFLCKEHR